MEVCINSCKKCCQPIRIWLFCTFIVCHSFSTVLANDLNDDYQQKLTHADNIRSSHRAEFNQILAELSENTAQLTIEQKVYLTYLQGYQKVISGEITEAIRLLDTVIQQQDVLFIKHRAIITKVNAFTFTENYQEGFLVLNQMLPMLEQMKNRETFHQALFVVSTFYNRLGQYQISKKYVSQLLSSFPSAKNTCVASMLKIEASYRLKEFTEEDIDNSIVDLCEQEQEFIASGIIYSFAGQWYLENGKPQKALELLDGYFSTIEKTQYYLIISRYNSLLAEAYYQLADYALAEQKALQVIQNIQDGHKSEAIVLAAKTLYLIAKKSNRFEQALEYHELYQEHRQLMNDDINKRNVSYQIAQKDNREKSHQIVLLAEKNKRLNVENELFEESAKSQKLQNFLLICLVLPLIFWAFRSYRVQSKLRDIADHDELTGIFNRRCFHELADSALKYCNKTHQPVSLLMFDLDHFKNINDRYGHHVGDWALVTTISTCKALCRKNDIIGRFGGEEFTILLPGCGENKAKELAEKYREAIENISTEEIGIDFKISASFGVFSSKEPNHSIDEVIKAADCAMYHAKQQGRNRVSIYGLDIIHQPVQAKT